MLSLVVLLGACTAVPWPAGAEVGDQLEVIADRSDGLRQPQDLAFDPEEPGRLWTVSRRDDSVTIVFDAGTPEQTTRKIIDPYALHFMEKVSSIAFGTPGHFATCQDSRNTYNGSSPGDDFTGPTLWSSDPDVFGTSNPDAVQYLSERAGGHVDLGSHLDMLHESPLCMGIAWEADNVYWVFDGLDGAIVRYDFQHDHGVGFDDHSDGVIARFARDEVKRVGGTVSHLVRDPSSTWLYIADTGNRRIAALDVSSGVRGDDLPVWEAGTDHFMMDDVRIKTLVRGERHDLERPAGIALIEDTLVVTDAGTGHIHFFDLGGRRVGHVDTGLGEGHLAGITGETLDDLWFVDAADDKVYRLRAE